MSKLPPSYYPQLVRALEDYLEADKRHDFHQKYPLRDQLRELVQKYRQAHPTGHTKSVAELAHDRARAGCEAGSTASQGA